MVELTCKELACERRVGQQSQSERGYRWTVRGCEGGECSSDDELGRCLTGEDYEVGDEFEKDGVANDPKVEEGFGSVGWELWRGVGRRVVERGVED